MFVSEKQTLIELGFFCVYAVCFIVGCTAVCLGAAGHDIHIHVMEIHHV